MREAERLAKRWGYPEIMLEVAQGNRPALAFYVSRGYKVLRADVRGTGATEVVNRGFYWDVRSVDKYVMRKSLLLPSL